MQTYGLQYDSTSARDTGALLVAKYINGKYASAPVRFGRGLVWIDVLGTAPYDAHWADVETGDITPQGFPSWNAAKHRGIGQWGGAYCNRSTLPQLLDALGGQPTDLWLATLDGDTHPPEADNLPQNVRLIAVQCYPESMTGFGADCSVVVDPDYWNARHA